MLSTARDFCMVAKRYANFILAWNEGKEERLACMSRGTKSMSWNTSSALSESDMREVSVERSFLAASKGLMSASLFVPSRP